MDELLDLNAKFLDYNNKEFGGTGQSFFPTNTTISSGFAKRAATVNKLEINISSVRDYKYHQFE